MLQLYLFGIHWIPVDTQYLQHVKIQLTHHIASEYGHKPSDAHVESLCVGAETAQCQREVVVQAGRA
jgi:hypothetical protein